MDIDTPLIKSVQYTQPRKVRHKNARTVLKKMPAGGKPYARGRKSMKKPKGAYRGAIMPRWAKGETKHILVNDQCVTVDPATTHASKGSPATANGVETQLDIGELKAWSLNPCLQGNDVAQRNGRSIDGTYLRVQGHIRNAQTGTGTGQTSKAYVRMLVLAVKGGQTATATLSSSVEGGTAKAAFIETSLFKKIDGSIVGFDGGTGSGDGAKRVRSLQLPVNKTLYTVLADQKMQLATQGESFGSSDRLFDLKIPIKQRTVFGTADDSSSFEKNQLVFVVYSADPKCGDALVSNALPLEFESKYSFKDF